MSTAESKRNPAARLHEILHLAWRQTPGLSSRQIWCEVFGIKNPDSEQSLFEVLGHLVALRKLFNETEELLRQIPRVNETLYIAPIPRLARVVDLNGLHNAWLNYSSYIQTEDMIALKYAEDLLFQHQGTQENEIPNSEIQEILNDLSELYESISVSSLPENLKASLLDLIQAMRNGVHEYRVRGASALRDALEKSLGTLGANREVIEENSASEEIQSLGRMLVRIDKLYTFAKKTKPLLEAAGSILPNILPRLLGS